MFKIGDKVKIGFTHSGFQSFKGPFYNRIGIIVKQCQDEPCVAYYVDVDNEKNLMFFENELYLARETA